MPKKNLKILPKIFSVNNSKDRKHKITTILGLKIKIKRKFNIRKIEKEIKSHYTNIDIPKILIVSHEFSHTGAPKVALLLTNTLKDIYKTSPIVISLKKGPLEKDFIDNNLKVIDIEEIFFNKQNFEKVAKNFDLVIMHSWCYKLLGQYSSKDLPPMIWYTHEAFEQNIFNSKYSVIRETANSMTECWTGSPLTQRGLKKICLDLDIKLLLYGVEDIKLPEVKKSNKIEFLFPATIQHRKGQDVLLKAIRELPKEIVEKANFTIIGDCNQKYLEQILKISKNIPSVKIISHTIPFEELMKYYAKADCIVIPSRFDPMPMVATYAFMFKKLCIMSDVTGTALLVSNNKNGILFRNGDYIELSIILKNIINNFEQYKPIAQEGYKIYQKHFFMNNFKKNIEKSLNNILPNFVKKS